VKNFAIAAFTDVGNAFDSFDDPLMYSWDSAYDFACPWFRWVSTSRRRDHSRG
jgi:hypothetical protein